MVRVFFIAIMIVFAMPIFTVISSIILGNV